MPMFRTKLSALGAAAAVVASLAGTVSATTTAAVGIRRALAPADVPGRWSQVTTSFRDVGVVPFQDIGLARGSDGVLHVIWASPGPTATHQVLDTAISPNGKVGPAVVIASGMQLPLSTNEEAAFGPDATVTPHGIDAFWNSLNDGIAATQEYRHPQRGGHWSFSQLVRPVPGFTGFDSSIAAATGIDGKPWTAYFGALAASFAVTVRHSGHAQREIVANAECCAAGPAFGIDARSRATWIGYQSTASPLGMFAQRLAQNGAMTGPGIFLSAAVFSE
jgi:hypothetical protein